MKQIHFTLTIIVALMLFSCFNPNSKEIDMSNYQTLTGQIVKKEFITKAATSTGNYELYLRCSIQDYFIKFCESNVTKKEIEALNLDEMDGITVEVEIKDGNWDICPSDPEHMQSRVGKYVVIYKVLD